MKLTNRTNIKIIDTFNSKYHDRILELCEQMQNFDIEYWRKEDYIKEKSSKSEYLEKFGYSPLGYTIDKIVDNTIKVYIIINIESCKELKLTEQEMLGSIAHEIGHLMNGAGYDHCQENEIHADHRACSLGLGKELLSTLEKLSKYNKFPEEIRNQLSNRIVWLRSFI